MKTIVTLFLLIPIAVILLVPGCTETVEPTEENGIPYTAITSPAQDQELSTPTTMVVVKTDENIPLAKMELYVDGAKSPSLTITAAPWIFNLTLSDLVDGEHTIIAKAYDKKGNIIASEPRRFVKKPTASMDERMLLVENFTNTGCTPCKAAEEDYERIIANEAVGSRTTTILYHVFWPDSKDPFYLANKIPVQQRVQYDSVKSAPHVRFNGFLRSEITLDFFKDWQRQMLEELQRPPAIGIRLTKELNGDVATITANITPYAQSFPSDCRYYLVITEDSLYYAGSNGVLIHPFVMREMVTGGLGEPITIQRDQPLTITKQVTLNPQWVKKYLRAVVFVQSQSSKLALQAAKIDLK